MSMDMCRRILPFMKFAGKLALLSLPFIGATVFYLVEDPFMVLHDYQVYDSDVTLNEEYIGWKIYMNKRDSAGTDSYIMGNSCTMAFRCQDWERYLDGGSAVRLFGNAESMKAIHAKLLAIEKSGGRMNNVLMVLDRHSLSKTSFQTGYGHILPSEMSGRSRLAVQMEFFQAFMVPDFFFNYLRYVCGGRKPILSRGFMPYGRVRNSANNDAYNPREKRIEQEGEGYWTSRPDEFPPRSGEEIIAPAVIHASQISVLKDIADVVRRNGADLRIVISPDYEQERINPEDIRHLKEIFGEDAVYDFTGVNGFTADIHDYYEHGHYRPTLGRRVLDSIYCRRSTGCHDM